MPTEIDAKNYDLKAVNPTPKSNQDTRTPRCRELITAAMALTPAMEAGLTDHIWTLKELLSKIGL
jgi:hypothetical protein